MFFFSLHVVGKLGVQGMHGRADGMNDCAWECDDGWICITLGKFDGNGVLRGWDM